MANNYNFQTQPQTQPQLPYQAQQFFPQPQGNAYLINNSLEVANVPMSAGMSVALCMSEGVMYIKTMQNGNPMFMAYKIAPYTQEQNQNQSSSSSTELDDFIRRYDEKIESLQAQINGLKNSRGGRINEQLL